MTSGDGGHCNSFFHSFVNLSDSAGVFQAMDVHLISPLAQRAVSCLLERNISAVLGACQQDFEIIFLEVKRKGAQ
ncbi:hypothetical protein D3C81_2255150 [compost metagenome]